MGGRNIIGSFSYNVKDMETVEQAEKMAKADGISFSEFVVALLKEEVHRKKVVGQGSEPNSLNLRTMLDPGITYVTEKQKRFEYPTLDQWIEKIKTLNSPQEIGRLQGYHHKAKEICKMRLEQIRKESFSLR